MTKPMTIAGSRGFWGVCFWAVFPPGGVAVVFSTPVHNVSEGEIAAAKLRLSDAEAEFTHRFAHRCRLYLFDNDEPVLVAEADGSTSCQLMVVYAPRYPSSVLRAVDDCQVAVEAAAVAAF